MPIQILLAILLVFSMACPLRGGHPPLFAARKNGAEVHVFGTFHMLPQGVAWYQGPITEAFQASKKLVVESVEARPTGLLDTWKTKRLLRRMKDPERLILGRRLPPEERQDYYAMLRALEMEPRDLDPLPSVLCAVGLGQRLLEKEGWQRGAGCEAILLGHARKAGKSIEHLESFTDSLDFLEDIPEEEGVAMVRELLAGWKAAGGRPAVEEAVARRWAQGEVVDAGALERAHTPVWNRVLLRQRNQRWAGWIEERAGKGESLFLAVGAAHLDGPHGLLAMLSQRGWKVDRVMGSTAGLPGSSQAR